MLDTNSEIGLYRKAIFNHMSNDNHIKTSVNRKLFDKSHKQIIENSRKIIIY